MRDYDSLQFVILINLDNRIQNILYHMQGDRYAIVIHGGSGRINKQAMSTELETALQQKLLQAAQLSAKILKSKGTALDAVEAAIRVLQDSQMFNAGKGAVLSAKGINELDASIMDGKTRKAGCVAGVTKIKNPITAARRVMEKTKHVFLTGQGANQFAKQQGLQIVQPDYFYSQLRYDQWAMAKKHQQVLAEQQNSNQHTQFDYQFNPNPDKPIIEAEKHEAENKFGTVGAVALDTHGNLAAGTSTGGMTNKKYGRVGDSPIIGAGCYANNKTCAVSSTGQGQYFMRGVVAYEISAIMQFANQTLQKAANRVIHERLAELGGAGGVIAVDGKGNIAMPFNTSGMYRAYIKSSGERQVKIYKQ